MNSAVGEFEIQHERVRSEQNPNSGYAADLLERSLALDLTAKSSFVSIRANTAITQECFYYEVTLLSDGLMQIGWCQFTSSFNFENGVGDSESSYAYDGHRCLKWHKESEKYGQEWSVGDVIGTLINLQTREIMFWRNSDFMGVAFNNIEVGQNRAYFPAISLQNGQRVQFNFGQRPFKHALSFSCLAINEPDCLINGYYSPGVQILEHLRSFIIAYEREESKCSIDEQLSVGCLMTDFLIPLMEDVFFMEASIVPFFQGVIQLKQPKITEIVFKVFDLSLNND